MLSQCGKVAHFRMCDGYKTAKQFCDVVHEYVNIFVAQYFGSHLTITNSFGKLVMWHTLFS